MDYRVQGNDIIVYEPDLDLDETLDCGQAFRWKKIPSDFMCTYEGAFLNDRLTVSQTDKGSFIFHNTDENDFISKWINYFDFETDYSELKRIFSEDETLSKACSFAGGIRLLKQNSWECLISFIISQNNNIPRIKGIIDRLCEHYHGKFPDCEKLSAETAESLSYLRSGFRAKYIEDAAQKTANGTLDLSTVSKMPIDEARAALKQIKGVGPKVAECVLLFGMYRTEAFPIDVWIKRVLAEYYPNGFPKFAEKHAGIAQQYLFHYIRSISKNDE
ncbi:DNA-3-methyladenine glycosylase family protein [Ruminococcus flavefaciens]|uniref:DNA-3-methyladenine glycosylase family protein n=1 Tax=Ruminococcus flavefaciens TaxID=1265 RepID=UPI0026EA8315|nr:DNA glycosylase [Ruminococcus flavefaciens]MDD7516047.1 DNA glycosylase [Ruminococcus flavefaciens]MDY5690414.1 DNA glycosylase [Ruminococcus flavefaciens]